MDRASTTYDNLDYSLFFTLGNKGNFIPPTISSSLNFEKYLIDLVIIYELVGYFIIDLEYLKKLPDKDRLKLLQTKRLNMELYKYILSEEPDNMLNWIKDLEEITGLFKFFFNHLGDKKNPDFYTYLTRLGRKLVQMSNKIQILCDHLFPPRKGTLSMV